MRSYQPNSGAVKHLRNTHPGTTSTTSMNPRAFLEALWGNPPPSEILIWMLPQKMSKWYSRFDHLNQDMAAYPDRDVYTGVGYPAPGTTKLVSNVRGVAVDIGAIPGMWADIDVTHPIHQKTNLPPTREQALALLAQLPFEPTIIIDSGHGLQIWWLFDKPWVFTGPDDNATAQKLAQWWNHEILNLFAQEGWTVDAVHDLARVLRIPGTHNNKDPNQRVPVTTVKEDGPRYKRIQFLEKVPADFRPTITVSRNRVNNEVNGEGFIMSPDAEPPHDKLMALTDVDPKFRTTWMADRPDLKDQSASAFDMSLANMAVRAGWNNQEIVDLMIAWRRIHGKQLKLREDYYARTLARARTSGTDQAELALSSTPDLISNPTLISVPCTADQPRPAAVSQPLRKDDPRVLEALARMAMGRAAENQNDLVAVGRCLKARGHDFQEWDSWAQSAGCTWIDRAGRWASFDATDKDYSSILDIAMDRYGLPAGRGRPRVPGSRSADRREKQDIRTNDDLAATKFIQGLTEAGETIYWLDQFYQRPDNVGGWTGQSEAFLSKQMRDYVTSQRPPDERNGRGTIIRQAEMAAFMGTIKAALLPPVIDQQLLKPTHYHKNYSLDTGQLIDGVSFKNAVVEFELDGPRVSFRGHGPREFYPSVKPYDFPLVAPARCVLFDKWLAERIPDPDTRQAVWELIGATVLHRGGIDHHLAMLIGKGGTGKGTLLRLLVLLSGTGFSSTGGPGRLATSPFALSQLAYGAPLVILPDMPKPPTAHGRALDTFREGAAILKSISGGDDVSVEVKNKDQVTIRPNSTVWMDSNFRWTWLTAGKETDDVDIQAWYRRLVFIPMNLVMETPVGEYEKRFIPELGAIAWYGAHSYLDKVRRGEWTWSGEMQQERRAVFGERGLDAALALFIQKLTKGIGPDVSRKELQMAASAWCGGSLRQEDVSRIYNSAEGIPGVKPVAINGNRLFRNLILPAVEKRVEH